jgi:hypothetical protein
MSTKIIQELPLTERTSTLLRRALRHEIFHLQQLRKEHAACRADNRIPKDINDLHQMLSLLKP